MLRPALRLLPILLALAWQSAWAVAPGHRWKTLESPHFVLHFHEGLYPTAVRALRSLEEAHERLVPFFGKGPRRKTQVVLTDHTDDANGSATAFGRPHIVLHAAPPDDFSILGDFDDWVFVLVAHEYAHVLHLGTIGGATDLLTSLFGGLFTNNAMQPRFVVEGLATYQESLFTSGGRMRSALADMYLRADFLEDRVLTLGQLAGGPLRWPRGTSWYLYGGSFLSYVASSRGDEAIRTYSQSYGSSILPYLLDPHFQKGADASFSEVWEEWREVTRLRYLAQERWISLQGEVTEPAIRTLWGGRTGAPRWGKSGSTLHYVEASEDRRPHLRTLDPSTGEDREIAELGVSGSLAPLPSGQVLVARSEVHRTHRFYGDLFLVDGGGERRLSKGLRASEADVSPDGRRAIFVRRGQGRTTLHGIALEEGAEPELVYEPPGGRQVYTPRFSPDGKWIVFSQDRHGVGRDLLLLSVEEGVEPIPLTDDDATNFQPSWFPDGERIVFSSDRTGVYNLYEVRIRDRTIRRLTNVLTGAFQPDVSADGAWLAWTTYSSRGFDVAVSPVSDIAPAAVAAFVSDRKEGRLRLDGELYPVRPYSPLETLAPVAWMPYVSSNFSTAGAMIWGGDPVGIHQWSLSAGYGFNAGQPEGAATYRFGNWDVEPSVSVASAERPVAPDRFERATTGALFLSYPFGTVRASQSVSLGYQATLFHHGRGPSDPMTGVAGVATEARGGWGIATTERPSESVSPEAGVQFSATARLGSRALGGDFDYRILTLQSGAFLRAPWARHHVFALLARGGTGSGDFGGRGFFALGGPPFESLVDSILNVLGESLLRGYRPASFVGDHLLLGGVEYRFPLTWIDDSPGVLPLYLGKLSGTVFTEAGNAFDSFPLTRLHPSVGAELRLSFHLGFGAIDGALRLGGAWGFHREEGGGFHPYLGMGAAF